MATTTINGVRRCSKCETHKPVAGFYKRMVEGRMTLQSECKECLRQRSRNRYKELGHVYHPDPTKKAEATIKYQYGLSWPDFINLFETQKGKCAICEIQILINFGVPKKEVTLNIDHCHSTGRVRGLLCPKCNRALGTFKDSSVMLRKAADYLDNPPFKGENSKWLHP